MAQLLRLESGALSYALKRSSPYGASGGLVHDFLQLVVEIAEQIRFQHTEIGLAGSHHGGCIGIVDQGEQEMLQGRIPMIPLIGVIEGAMCRR